MQRLFLIAGLAGVMVSLAPQAFAQANANAVTGAGDAFGFKNGAESVGIYDETSVRGFNLEAAGNYRVNGSYFVRNSGVSAFFVDTTTVRIGYSTLASLLPGPSGVVEYRLRDPVRGEPSALTVGIDIYNQPMAELQLKHRTADDAASYSIGLGRVFDVRDMQGGRRGESLLLAGVGRVTRGSTTVQGFFGESRAEKPGQFRVRPSADALPHRIKREAYLGQDWTMEKGQRRIAGLLLDTRLSDRAGVGATGVVSQEDPTRGFTQLFTDFAADGSARASVIAVPQQRSTAWSGELRAWRDLSAGAITQRIDVTVRGRLQRAFFGGSQVVDLGRAPFGTRPADRMAPTLDNAAARLRDEVDQWGVGLTYRAAIEDRVRLNLGLLRTDYSKTFLPVGPPQKSETAPLLYNGAVALRLTRGWELYGSYSRGLEEAGVAPAVATNRNQVLSAIEVTQRELGARYTAAANLAIVAAAFDTRKPYAGIDGAGAYGFVGEVQHRGIEASLSSRPIPGLAIVLGAVAIDPRLSGAEIDAGRIGRRPVGVPKLRAIASVDYALRAVPGLNIDAGATFVGERPASSRPFNISGQQLQVERITTMNAGLRYRFRVGGHDLVARGQVQNLLDQYSWEVNSSETLAYSAPRRYRLVLTAFF